MLVINTIILRKKNIFYQSNNKIILKSKNYDKNNNDL